MPDTLILGLGNPFRGDDGLGSAVIAALKTMDLPPESAVFIDAGTPGLELLLLWQGYHRVIIVDAAEMGRQPGDWVRFTSETAVLQTDQEVWQGTLHSVGLAEAIALAKALNSLPEELIFYGVQPQMIGWAAGLSPAVAQSVPLICQEILQELNTIIPFSYPLG